MPFASSVDATADTVPAPSKSGLGMRLVSALVLIAVALAATFLGSPYFDILVIAFGGVMAWEWGRLIGGGKVAPAAVVAILAVVGAIFTLELASPGLALAALVAGALLAGGMARRGTRGAWLTLGVLYVGLPCLALLWLRAGTVGLQTVLWMFALVWATDTGAYFAGRAIGGPKLMPSVSPKKTWAGLIGGVLAAAAAGAVSGALIAEASPWLLAVASALLAVIAQIGDLGESALKRRFGAKDSSGLIPGHGGVLDRVDGLVTVILVVAAATLLAGRSVVAW